MEKGLYFKIGGKSYEISRKTSEEETWFVWVERSHNMMRKVTFSHKTMLWIVYVMHKASQGKGNIHKTWKFKEFSAQYFGTLKYNKWGRFISFIALQGENRGAIIVPEVSSDAGWIDIANKIKTFVEAGKEPQQVCPTRDLEASFVDTLRQSRWQSSQRKEVQLDRRKERIVIHGEAFPAKDEVLSRCLVGTVIGPRNDRPTPNELRRWVYSTWTKGIQVFEMNNHQYLFEFPSRKAVVLTMLGSWRCQNSTITIQWWSPEAGCVNESSIVPETWIRIVGLPLSLWDSEVFKLIGEVCGGWLETEEETSLKNHLKWARVKVKATAENISSAVEVDYAGKIFRLPVWCELPAKIMDGEEKAITQRAISRLPAVSSAQSEHVGTSRQGQLLNSKRSCDKAHAFNVAEHGPGQFAGHNSFHCLEPLSEDPQAQGTTRFNEAHDQAHAPLLNKRNASTRTNLQENLDTVCMQGKLQETKDLATKFLNSLAALELQSAPSEKVPGTSIITYNQSVEGLSKGIEHTEGTDFSESAEEEDYDTFQDKELQEIEDMLGKLQQHSEDMQIFNRKEPSDHPYNNMQLINFHGRIDGDQQMTQVKEVQPLATFNQREMEAENEASNWVKTHVLELSKKYGVNFVGFEKEALALFSKIDKKKRASQQQQQAESSKTKSSTRIGKNELRNLQSDLIDKVQGARSRCCVINEGQDNLMEC